MSYNVSTKKPKCFENTSYFIFFIFFKIKAVLLVWPKVERQGYRPVKVTCVCRHLVASSENEIDALQCIAMRQLVTDLDQKFIAPPQCVYNVKRRLFPFYFFQKKL